MWVARTPEEVAKWESASAREARTQGLLTAGGLWLILTPILAGGWIAGARMGVVAQDSAAAGSFWSRLPIFAVVDLPFAYWLFRHERRKQIARSREMTICPKCDTAGEGNAGEACNCGGSFVLQSSVRWVDDPESET
jgi:hypothetical protein